MCAQLNKHDRVSLLLHSAVKRELVAAPEKVIDIAIRNIYRWDDSYKKRPPIMQKWLKILKQGVPAIIDVLDGTDQEPILLRSSTPFTGIISQEERKKIIRELSES